MMTISLVELAWRSTLVSGVALALSILAAPRVVAERLNFLRVGLVMLLSLPATTAIPVIRLTWLDAGSFGAVEPLQSGGAFTRGGSAVLDASASAASGLSLLNVYLAGVVVALLWTGAGIAALACWTRSADPSDCPRWNNALARFQAIFGLQRVRLLVSRPVRSPLSWGLRKPVILVDVRSHARSDHAEAIIAHEIAHIARHDWATLLASRVALALFWFNPLVWLFHRSLIEAVEHAADRRAIANVERLHYADMLLSQVERHRLRVPANAVAPGALRTRISAIVRCPSDATDTRRWPRLAASWVAIAILVPIASLRFAPTLADARPLAATRAPDFQAAPSALAQAHVANGWRAVTPSQSAGSISKSLRRDATSSRATRATRADAVVTLDQAQIEAAEALRIRDEAQFKSQQTNARTAAAYLSGSASQRGWADGERGRAEGELGRATGDAARANARRIWTQIELERVRRR